MPGMGTQAYNQSSQHLRGRDRRTRSSRLYNESEICQAYKGPCSQDKTKKEKKKERKRKKATPMKSS